MNRDSIDFSAFDHIWSSILSMDEKVINSITKVINQDELHYIIDHLEKMVSEDGWQPAQQESAEYALGILKHC